MSLDIDSYELKEIRDICDINCSSYSQKESWNFFNYLDTKNITKGKIDEIKYLDPLEDTVPSRAKRKVNNKDIIYSTVRPNQEHYGLIENQPDNFLVSTGFTTLKVDTEKAIPEYVYYFITQNHITESLQTIAEQSTTSYPSIRPSDIGDLLIPLPPLGIQNKISSILRNIDYKIKLNEQINKNLEQFSKNLFKKWFIDFDLKNDFGICEDFKDSSLGEIPQSWEIRTVGELSDVKGRIGWRGYTTNDLVDDGPWVIGGKEITSGFIDFSSAKHLTREKYEESPEIMLKDKDLIIAKTGTIGPIAMFYEGFGEATLNPNVGLIRSKNISPALLLTFFKTPRAQYYLNEFTTSSVQPAINQTTIKQLEVALPSDISLLNKISLIFDEINDMQYNLIEEVKKLSILRDTLLPKLMAGEIDVSKINCDLD